MACTLHFEYSSTLWPVARPQHFSYPSSLSLDIPYDGVTMAHKIPTGSRGKLLLPTLISALVIILSVALVVEYYTSNQKRPECNPDLPGSSNFIQTGFTPVCGVDEASDGRLDIAVHNFHFAQAKDIQFHFAPNQQSPLPDEVFMVVNVTVENVGGGNTTVGAGWEAEILNSTSYVEGVTNFIANATFHNTYPNQTIPNYAQWAGLYLPPGSHSDFWIFFYVPFPTVDSSNIVETSNFRLQFLVYRELSYGGTYLGNGSMNCRTIACQTPDVEFIVQPQKYNQLQYAKVGTWD